MKKVYIEDLPKRNYNNRICIDWDNTIGMKVQFICENIEGYVTILSYDNKKCRLKIEYDNIIFDIAAHHFIDGKLSNMLGIKTTKYKYNIGEVINSIEILEQIRYGNLKYKVKGYKIKCLIDGYIGQISETSLLKGVGCPVCSNNLVIKGINDITTTNPELIKYFNNEKEACLYSYGSKVELKFKCPECGYVKEMAITTLSHNGFNCNKCGDGIPYPEKFMFNVLEQLNVEFYAQKHFSWSRRKIYDFYLPYYSCIIETHGLQHYKNTGGVYKTYQREIENDEIKLSLALENNISNYVVLDCRKSESEYIKESILNSELNKLFNLENINWDECHKSAIKSNVIKACQIWNDGTHNVKIIAEILKLNPATIRTYLKQATNLGWCNYDGKKEMGKSWERRLNKNV